MPLNETVAFILLNTLPQTGVSERVLEEEVMLDGAAVPLYNQPLLPVPTLNW